MGATKILQSSPQIIDTLALLELKYMGNIANMSPEMALVIATSGAFFSAYQLNNRPPPTQETKDLLASKMAQETKKEPSI